MPNFRVNSNTREGGCLCEAVRYEVSGPLRPVVSCHCRQCQKTSGHHVSATQAKMNNFRLTEDKGLTWFRSSHTAERGFCSICGGNLFWRQMGTETISIFAGTLDQPSGLKTAEHIFVADKADYYDINDALPQHEASSK